MFIMPSSFLSIGQPESTHENSCQRWRQRTSSEIEYTDTMVIAVVVVVAVVVFPLSRSHFAFA